MKTLGHILEFKILKMKQSQLYKTAPHSFDSQDLFLFFIIIITAQMCDNKKIFIKKKIIFFLEDLVSLISLTSIFIIPAANEETRTQKFTRFDLLTMIQIT